MSLDGIMRSSVDGRPVALLPLGVSRNHGRQLEITAVNSSMFAQYGAGPSGVNTTVGTVLNDTVNNGPPAPRALAAHSPTSRPVIVESARGRSTGSDASSEYWPSTSNAVPLVESLPPPRK